jgi:hypothetical protein
MMGHEGEYVICGMYEGTWKISESCAVVSRRRHMYPVSCSSLVVPIAANRARPFYRIWQVKAESKSDAAKSSCERSLKARQRVRES